MQYAITSSNRFNFELLRAYRKENPLGNLFYSPVNISMTLAMLCGGARSSTLREIEAILSIEDHNPVLSTYDALFSFLQIPSNENFKLSLTNVLAIQENVHVLPEFDNIVTTSRIVDVKRLPFETHPEESREEINGVIEEATQGKIKNLLPPYSIEYITQMVLATAIYFKAEWYQHFDRNLTKKQLFYALDNTVPMVDMMFREGDYNCVHNYDLNSSILELPYAESTVSMIIILPIEPYDLPLVENIISEEVLNNAIREMYVQSNVRVSFPKFKLDERFPLEKCLNDMGMKEAFTDNADFSGITGGKDIKISKAEHRAYVDIDEKGTEAAAATTLIFLLTSALVEPVYFVVDHPFMFFIIERDSGLILFTGSVNKL